MGKKDNDTRGLADVEMYFTQIRSLLKQYGRLVERLDAIKKDKRKADEKIELLTERDGLKNQWLAKKNACRANIKLLPESLGILKEKELKDLQEEFRETDGLFKALGLMAERNTLLDGAAERQASGRGGTGRMNNDELLDSTLSTQQNTTNKLRDALSQVEQTKETARYTAATLEQDREKIKRIDQGLDEVESELEISRKLITRFVKRIYTDKIIIAFTFLIVAALVGIIVYSTMNPNQKIFNVPDAMKPTIPGITVSQSVTPGPTPSVRVTARLLRAGRSGLGVGAASTESLTVGGEMQGLMQGAMQQLHNGGSSLLRAARQLWGWQRIPGGVDQSGAPLSEKSGLESVVRRLRVGRR